MSKTVKELIQDLSKLPQDSIVLVQGYEDGLSDIALIKQINVTLNCHSEEWNGPHEEDSNGYQDAVLLYRSATNPNSK